MPTSFKMHRSPAVLILLTALGFSAWADPPAQVGRLNYVGGEVSFLSGSLDEWVPATRNYPLTAGDRLWTDVDSRAEVHVRAAALRLDSSTDFSFVNLDDQIVQVGLMTGTLSVTLRGLDAGDVFEIDTPDATVSMLGEGDYRVDVHGDGRTEVTVRQGTAEVTAGEDAFDVRAGRSASISGANWGSYSVGGAPAPDDWDAWCQARDERELRVASARYVPREMIGAEDLDDNGTWWVEADYGPVWAPSRVPAGWAPYRFGRWAWVEPWGWTWIDDSPWGFAPFHYGRWAFFRARWIWVPGAMAARPLYAPALVVFVGGSGWRPDPHAGEGIGWFPLGPHEVYLPPYQASPTYVQRINVTHVTRITVQIIESLNVHQTTYVNRSVPEALTFVPHDTFVRSKPAEKNQISVSKAELKKAPLLGMTAKVAPQRESVLGQPASEKSPVAHPATGRETRRIYSRTAPPPAPVPFSSKQESLRDDPGRPLDKEALARLQSAESSGGAKVTVVSSSKLRRVEPPAEKKIPVKATTKTSPPPATTKERASTSPAPAAKQKTATAPGKKADTGVAAMIQTLKTRSLPDADRQLAEARKVKNIRLDFNAVARQLSAARTALAGAERDLAGGDASRAQQTAAAVQKQIEEQVRIISAAIKAARGSR